MANRTITLTDGDIYLLMTMLNEQLERNNNPFLLDILNDMQTRVILQLFKSADEAVQFYREHVGMFNDRLVPRSLALVREQSEH